MPLLVRDRIKMAACTGHCAFTPATRIAAIAVISEMALAEMVSLPVMTSTLAEE